MQKWNAEEGATWSVSQSVSQSVVNWSFGKWLIVHLCCRRHRLRLDPPPGSRAHDVVHVRLCRKELGEDEALPSEHQGAGGETGSQTAIWQQRAAKLETQVSVWL